MSGTTWADIRPSTVDVTASTVTAAISQTGTISVGRLVPTEPCIGADYRAFDFWVGSWNMTDRGQNAGQNSITMEPGGCAIFENYVTQTPISPGRSISFFNADEGVWYQHYIDAGGNQVRLRSISHSGNQIVMVTPVVNNQMGRTTWSLNPNGTVRQFIEASGNSGQTWVTAYDMLYAKK